jgi:hypothetical protein
MLRELRRSGLGKGGGDRIYWEPFIHLALQAGYDKWSA